MEDLRAEILYFKPAREAPWLIERLRDARWRVHVAASDGEAAELARRHALSVGLAHLPTEDLGTRADALCSLETPLEWIGLIDTEAPTPALHEVIARHCLDYHTLPPDMERLLFSLRHAQRMAGVRRSIEPGNHAFDDYEMVGTSEAMLALFRSIRKVAGVDAPVLINGESGTGKELTARAIHERSQRAAGPFIAVNCGALPSTLIQAELFGHEKGAFTGAHERKQGFIEAASGGTLFLDEIGDLSPDLQANLLRFLQEQVIHRVGGRESVAVDVRVIAATHVDLQRAVESGPFREDLYYRLNVLHLKVPPLRERAEDIEVLAHFFFRKFAAEGSAKLKGFHPKALHAMNGYRWPGNVRELINRVRRAVVMTDKRLVSVSDLGLATPELQMPIASLEEVTNAAERQAICASLRVTGNNISKAAQALGVSRMTLYRLLQKHGIQP